jgi:hypothetical protein
MTAEPVAPRGRDPFLPLQFAYRPGNGMTISESSEGLPVMAMLVVAASSVPSVMMTAASAPSVVMTASPMPMCVAVTVPMLDLDHGAVLRGHRRHAEPRGGGYGHCQQRKNNQGDTSHTVSSVRVIATSGTSSPRNVLFRGARSNSPAAQ